jgi:trans-2,3-dihydro-3-hydroxyanthranilate isomerase
MRRRFATLDVFTTTRFTGNPLAVVLDSEGLDTPTMQSIAREFNLSETVFVLPPADPGHRAALRIFTPGGELPFAGHPTVGTAVLLRHLDGPSAKSEMVLEERIGAVRCRTGPSSAATGRAEFDVPRLPVHETDTVDLAAAAAALGLTTNDVGDADNWPAERWSAGNPFTFLPLRSLDAIGRCEVDRSLFKGAFRGRTHPAVFVYCRETADARNTFHARMFSPSMGIVEDPATGSAAAAFAGYLAQHGTYANGEHEIRIEQGFEMGRPSLMELTLRIRGGELVGAAIGGDAVIVSEGTLHTGTRHGGHGETEDTEK